jgi:CheY-like chemotaxis protein
VFTTIMKQERRSQKSPEVTGKILLVDPNPLDLETYTDILQHFGHEVRMCPSYDEALHLVERDNFDLVIIGQSGSQFGGRTVLEQLHTGENRAESVLSKTQILTLMFRH